MVQPDHKSTLVKCLSDYFIRTVFLFFRRYNLQDAKLLKPPIAPLLIPGLQFPPFNPMTTTAAASSPHYQPPVGAGINPFSILAAVGAKPNDGKSNSLLDIQAQALLNVMAHQTKQKLEDSNPKKRPASPEPTEAKRPKKEETSKCLQMVPCSHEAKVIKDWTVDQVSQFVETIDELKPYVKVSSLSLLTRFPWKCK